MTQTIKLKGGSAVVECLKQEGVRYVFGIPGGQNLAIMDALYDAAPDIQFITAHDERGAACMADGYARLTGKPGVCLVTTGPGATNLLTGVGGAFRDSSPVILLTANNRSADLQRDNAQEADHVALFERNENLVLARAPRGGHCAFLRGPRAARHWGFEVGVRFLKRYADKAATQRRDQ